MKATCEVLGKIFSGLSELSILNNCIPPTFKRGSTVIAITIIPTPPSHCIIALHSSILFGDASKFVTTVEPVVVIPDMLSKKASLNEKLISERMNGNAPNTAIAIHAKVEKKKSLFKI